jgi:hypothetical protein
MKSTFIRVKSSWLTGSVHSTGIILDITLMPTCLGNLEMYPLPS